MDVAVKVIHASLMQSMDRRKLYQDTFIDEATLMMRLKHPHLQTMEGAHQALSLFAGVHGVRHMRPGTLFPLFVGRVP
jgi:hypothetical protein